MPCWNGLSVAQQRQLIERGNLPIGYVPEGICRNGADLCVETRWDSAPGPRFYCVECAGDYLRDLPGHGAGGRMTLPAPSG
jgi:hypothetical protein